MAFYLMQPAFTPSGADHLVQRPQHREEVLRKTWAHRPRTQRPWD